jgi:hypothetical protein
MFQKGILENINSWTLRPIMRRLQILEFFGRIDGILEDANYVQIGNVSKYDTEFEDKYVEGGVLYAHK